MNDVFVLGSFVVDTAYRAARLPSWGETLLGSSFALGPGGKGSNQAVAAARAGAHVAFLTKIGLDPFGDIGRRLWAEEGIDASLVLTSTYGNRLGRDSAGGTHRRQRHHRRPGRLWHVDGRRG